MENNGGKYSGFFSKKLRAGKRRTYFFDVRSTKQGDYFLTITESKKKFDSDGYESHKIFLYKEDFKKFMEGLQETIDHVKTELMPDFDFDAFNHDENPDEVNQNGISAVAEQQVEIEPEKAAGEVPVAEISSVQDKDAGEVDKW